MKNLSELYKERVEKLKDDLWKEHQFLLTPKAQIDICSIVLNLLENLREKCEKMKMTDGFRYAPERVAGKTGHNDALKEISDYLTEEISKIKNE